MGAPPTVRLARRYFGEAAASLMDAAFGRGAWTIIAPRAWIRQQENDWVLNLG